MSFGWLFNENDFESDKLNSNLEVSINFRIYDYEMNDLKDLLIICLYTKLLKRHHKNYKKNLFFVLIKINTQNV